MPILLENCKGLGLGESEWLYVILKSLVLYCMESMVTVLTETPVLEGHPGDQWVPLKVLMCRGRSVTTVLMTEGWLSLWTFCRLMGNPGT